MDNQKLVAGLVECWNTGQFFEHYQRIVVFAGGLEPKRQSVSLFDHIDRLGVKITQQVPQSTHRLFVLFPG